MTQRPVRGPVSTQNMDKVEAAPLIPRDVLFGNPERKDAQVSPDGRYLSWLAPLDGRLELWVAPRDDRGVAWAVPRGADRPIHEYRWARTSNHLLYLQDAAGDENHGLFVAEVVERRVRELIPPGSARVQIYATSELHPTQVAVGTNERDPQLFDVYLVDVATGERQLTYENREGFVDYVFDAENRLRLGQKMTQEGGCLWLSLTDDTTLEPSVAEVSPEDLLSTKPLLFARDGRSMIWLDSRNRDRAALLRYPWEGGEPTVLAQSEFVDIEQALVQPTSRRVDAFIENYEKPRLIPLHAEFADHLSQLGDVLPRAACFEIVSRAEDDSVWVVRTNSDQGSPAYFLYEKALGEATFLFEEQPALSKYPLSRTHPKKVQARDGLGMVSYLTLPRESDDEGMPTKPLPTVLLVHGGPWMRDSWGFRPLPQTLANRGYAVLQVNFRGSTGFGKSFVNAGNFEWGKAMQDDLLDAVEWLVKNGVAVRDRIAIMGGSYGGYATLAGLTLSPDTFACGVDIVGPSSLVTLMETIPPYWKPMLSLFHSRVGDPRSEEGRQRLLDVSPLTHADAISRPLLIAQGANDPRVKESESEQIVERLKSKDIPVSYVVFPDEGHGFAHPQNAVAFIALAEGFLSRSLGGRALAMTHKEQEAANFEVRHGAQLLQETGALPSSN